MRALLDDVAMLDDQDEIGVAESVGSALSSVPLGPLTVTTLPAATFTSTPAGIATGSLPIRDIILSSLLKLSERKDLISLCFQCIEHLTSTGISTVRV